MTRTTRRLALAGALAAAAAGVAVAAAPVPWEDLTEADWLYAIATRFADVDGHRVHYPTPDRRARAAARAAQRDRRAAPAGRRAAGARRSARRDRGARGVGREPRAPRPGPRPRAGPPQQGELAFAFRAAARALPGLAPEDQGRARGRARRPGPTPTRTRPTRSRCARNAPGCFPTTLARPEDWLRALEKAGRLDEAHAAVETALGPAAAAPAAAALRSRSRPRPQASARSSCSTRPSTRPRAGRSSCSGPTRSARTRRTPALPESWRATLEAGLRRAGARAPRHLLPGPGARRRGRRAAAPGGAALRGEARPRRLAAAGAPARRDRRRARGVPRPARRVEPGERSASRRTTSPCSPGSRCAPAAAPARLGRLQRRAVPLGRARRPHARASGRAASRSC